MALAAALADAGLQKSDVDGYFAAVDGFLGATVVADDAASLAEYLGIRHRFLDGTSAAGASYVFHLQHAMAAIRAGMCDVGAITYGSDLLSSAGRVLGVGIPPGRADSRLAPSGVLEAPYGGATVANYALIAQRQMYELGTTPEELAAFAVTARKHAALNPNAMYREPITVDDVLASPIIADPLHRLDCCVVSDGGGAVIVTTADRAQDLDCIPIHVLGAATRQTHARISQMPDLTRSGGIEAGEEAMRMAGVSHADIDVLQLYDSFTITALRLLEDLGFCKRGEAGSFALDGGLELGGPLPFNTDGGGLSATHPGRRGIFLIIEAVRQLRGQAGAAQVPDAELAMIAASGGVMSFIATAVLGRTRS